MTEFRRFSFRRFFLLLIGTLTAIAVVLVVLNFLVGPPSTAIRGRSASAENMKYVLLGLYIHADERGTFPPCAIFNDEGKPLLSWRVRILPYLDMRQLYKQFRLDEPWDSEHNQGLISEMPPFYMDPKSKWKPKDGRTHYLAVKGEGLFMDGKARGRFRGSFRDGVDETIILVQVNDESAVIWTKPDDWEFDVDNPLRGLTDSLHQGRFFAGYPNGQVRTISQDIDSEVFKAMLTIAGGEAITRN